jgi:hypothetical protein
MEFYLWRISTAGIERSFQDSAARFHARKARSRADAAFLELEGRHLLLGLRHAGKRQREISGNDGRNGQTRTFQ